MNCPLCHRPCEAVLVDFGIGPYEFWGAPGVHVDECVVSDCCEEPIPDMGKEDLWDSTSTWQE